MESNVFSGQPLEQQSERSHVLTGDGSQSSSSVTLVENSAVSQTGITMPAQPLALNIPPPATDSQQQNMDQDTRLVGVEQISMPSAVIHLNMEQEQTVAAPTAVTSPKPDSQPSMEQERPSDGDEKIVDHPGSEDKQQSLEHPLPTQDATATNAGPQNQPTGQGAAAPTGTEPGTPLIGSTDTASSQLTETPMEVEQSCELSMIYLYIFNTSLSSSFVAYNNSSMTCPHTCLQ